MTGDDGLEDLKRRQAVEDAKDLQLENYLNQIGAKSLANELGELRLINRIIERSRWLDFHEARIFYEEQLHDKLEHRIMANQSASYDKSQNYINFIITLGYAGFFAIWNLVKGFMHPWDMKLVAILLGTSLFIFIIWTLISMIVGSFATIRTAKAIRANHGDREGLQEAIASADNDNFLRALRLQRFWFPTFLTVVATGFFAGFLLLSLLLLDIIGIRFSIHNLFFSK